MASPSPWQKWVRGGSGSSSGGVDDADLAADDGPPPGAPLVRVPRGLGLLMVAVAAGLVLLAYWVGHRRGASEAIAAVDAERRAEQVLVDDGRRGSSKVVAVLTGVGPKSAVNTLPKRSDGVTTVPPVDDDPRVEGLNYFVLARDSLAGANRLLKFLGEQGVEAAAIKGDNATTYKVVAIGEAFTREELGNGRFKAFRRRLVEIGRRWEENFDGVVSFEKQGMYAERHRPMTGPVTVVTRRMIP